MKKHIILFACLCYVSVLFAQRPVPVGKGSYAEYTPLSKSRTDEHGGDQSRFMETRKLYITDKSKDLPVPTNDWWTDILTKQYSGNLWSYPQMVKAEDYGVSVAFPKEWESTGHEMKWKSQIEILGRKFKPESADANTWHDWGFDFLMKDNEKEMLVTLAHGVPFTWVETKNIEVRLRAKDAVYYTEDGTAQFPYTGSEIVVQIGSDAYGVYVPDGTLFSEKDGLIELTFKGSQQYLSIGVLPSKDDLMAFAEYAYTIPRKTEVVWDYNETAGKVSTRWDITTENLKGGTQKNILQGFIPHHYKNSEFNFSFLPYEYATPRGKMKMSTGKSFTISYKFNGMLPYYAAPEENGALKNPYQRERMKQMISEYADKGGFGADTYWGGKGLIQMGLYMTFAYEMGEMELFEKCKTRLKSVLTNWLTYTPGENSFFFARYNRWGALVGYDTSYDSDTFNDHHFHYGYFTYASSLLALFDEDFRNNYGNMITLIAKDYANWDREDNQFPFFRTFDPWAGHSYAGGLGNNGNGQESSSEAMQSWGGMYLLGVATNNKAMRDAGIFGWTLEARGISEYWFDRDKENIDYTKYTRPYNSNLTSQGIGWWTWFSGDPVWMHSIQWMPISPCQNHLYEDLDWARWDYTTMWNSKEVGSWTTELGLPSSLSYESGLGNVVLSYLQVFEPDSAASVFDRMWDAGMQIVKDPDTGGISYFITHSHRSYGDICWDIHADIPTATTYKDPKTNKLTHVVYNPDTKEKSVKFYQNGALIKDIKVPAQKMTVYSDAPVLSAVEIKKPQSSVVEPGKTLQLEAVLLDQYDATVEGSVVWSINQGNGTITQEGLFTATNSKGLATVVVQKGLLNDVLELRIDDKPVLSSTEVVPQQTYLEVGKKLAYSIVMKDQYDGIYNAKVDWQILKDGQVVKSDSILDLQDIGIYTVKASVEGKSYTSDVFVSPPLGNIALGKKAFSSSEENVGTETKYVNDGDYQTRWGSAHNDPEWVYIDLGTTCYVSHVSLVWEPAYSTLYEIQISDTGDNWQTIKTVNGLGGTETIDINADTRYVRMFGRERVTPYGHSLYEFEIYGVPPMGTDPVLFGIDIQPRQAQIKEGESINLRAIGYDQFGHTIDVTPEYRIMSGEGSITSEGVFIPSKYGTAIVSATVGSQTVKANFIVEEAVKLRTVSISPKKAMVIQGESQTFTCTSQDQFGVSFPTDELVYSVIGEGGQLSGSTFTADKVGEYKVIVGSGDVRDTALVEVAKLEEINLAYLKPAYASSYENDATKPSFVNDGDTETRWGSEFSDPQYIIVDLQDNFVIDNINILWDGAYATSYNVEVSLDEEDWITVFSETSGSGGEKDILMPSVAARYVRVWCNSRHTVYGSSIKEIEVYGSSFWRSPEPKSIDVEPNPVVAYIGEDLQVSPQLFDQYGLSYAAQTVFEWSVNGGAIVDGTGKLTPTTTGEFTLMVRYGNLTGRFPVLILPEKSLARVEISPACTRIKLDESVQLMAKGLDQYGNEISISPMWSTQGGQVSAEGLFSSNVAGNFEVKAVVGNITVSANIEVFEADLKNIALNKPATSSSGEANAAVDGNIDSRWESAFRDGPEWLIIDLGDAYKLSDAEIVWEEASARNYEIQVSKDGNNWTTIKEVIGLQGERTDTWRISGMGQYVRVWCTKRSTDYGYSIWEFRLYGSLVEDGEAYSVEFIDPKTELEINETTSYSVKVLDKKGTILDNAPLSWSLQGLGNIAADGGFSSQFSGNTILNVSSGLATASLSIEVQSPNSLNDESVSDNVKAWIINNNLIVEGNSLQYIALYNIHGYLLLNSKLDSVTRYETILPDVYGVLFVQIKTAKGMETIKLIHNR